MEIPQFSTPFADTWKGEHKGKGVAATVLKIYLTSDSERIKKVDCPRFVTLINKLTVSCAAVLRGGHDVEDPSSSKRLAVGGCDNDRKPARDGVTVDGEWEYHPVSDE
jgi:hypothetical protein